MDAKTLEELENLNASSTPGPWVVRDWDGTLGRIGVSGGHTATRPGGEPKGPSTLQIHIVRGGYGNVPPEGELIAIMRNALPALLAAAREGDEHKKLLRAVLESDSTGAIPCVGEGCPFCALLTKIRAALAGKGEG